ncbi:DUF262 domain-containing protein [Pseudomonas sp. CG7]|uniref:DUF262 domain-containing protein n=1 Tax=Pseudomonas sp. CG7 TaxID=191007 RepID=UPI00203464D5|nr:DUF262 domain-containing protein [Pseudomonas sp. CG7]MCM2461532.1 DUF262 domain-containing protein [Pseudomonas sp. CG7]
MTRIFKVQAHATRTLSWWFKQKDKIDFEPSYQRKGNLWGDFDKAYLIDSIINEFDIPKIYLSDFTIVNSPLNEKSLPYAVIDGRQRLEAIFSFFSDLIPLNSDFVYYKNPSVKVGGKFYSQLKTEHSDIVESLEEFNLDIMSVITDDVEKIRDLFIRLNKSKPLTGAELRNAMEGIVPDLIRGLSDRSFFKSKVKFSTTRGQDNNLAAKLLLIEYNEHFVDTKKKQLDKMVKDGANTENPDKLRDAAFRAKNTIDRMELIFHEKDPLLANHGLIPLYYQLSKNDVPPSTIRQFLEHFDTSRKINQNLARTNPNEADSAYLSFDSAVRSINDASTLNSAFSILNTKLNEYISIHS